MSKLEWNYKNGLCSGCTSYPSSKGVAKRKVLLRVVYSAKKTKSLFICCSSYSEFHILDLDTGELSKTRFTLLGDAGMGSIVSIGSVIYTIGKPRTGTLPPDFSDYYKYFKHENDIVEIHEGLSSFDLNKPQLGWKKGPHITEDKFFPNCVALCGKLYVFRSSDWSCFGEVFDPKLGNWDPLPKPPPFSTKYEVSPPLVCDHLQNRILIHFDFPFTSSIYAYYPPDANWECLVDDFDGDWLGQIVFVDGVIYFYACKSKHLLQAYDLHRKQWLNVVVPSEFEEYSKYVFDALHHLGDELMCFTAYSYKLRGVDPPIIEDHTIVLAVQFKVQRSANGNEVLLTQVSSKISPFESCCNIYGHLAI